MKTIHVAFGVLMMAVGSVVAASPCESQKFLGDMFPTDCGPAKPQLCLQWVRAHARSDRRVLARYSWKECDTDPMSKQCEQWIMAAARYDFVHPLRPPCDEYGPGLNPDGKTCGHLSVPPWVIRLDLHDSMLRDQQRMLPPALQSQADEYDRN